MTNKNELSKKQRGFTIVELLIATSVFSVVLLVVSTGVIKIGQSYYKGIIQARTQEVTRSVAEDISRTIQLSDGQVGRPPGVDNIVCVGGTRYTYYLNQKVEKRPSDGSQAEGLISQTIQPDTACGDTTSGTDEKELLGQNMRLLKFEVKEPSGLEPTWRIDVRIAYGDDDLLSHYNNDDSPSGWNGSDTGAAAVEDALCKSGIPGGSFCATSKLDILVKKRLN